jgi:hypothetical protein
MSFDNMQPSISTCRVLVKTSHCVLQTAVGVHVQRIELCRLKSVLVQRTGASKIDSNIRCGTGISEPIFFITKRHLRSAIIKSEVGSFHYWGETNYVEQSFRKFPLFCGT